MKKRTIEEVPTASLKEYDKNAKVHTDRQVQLIARGIERFGFNVPIVADGGNTIVAGHGRLLAARKLGLVSVPVIRVSDLSEEEVKAYRLADNQLNAMTDVELSLVIEELKGLDPSLVDLTGYDPDLSLEIEEDDFVPDLGAETVSKLGDLYELGDHRLLCGDSTKEDDYNKLLGEEKARLIFTDPPYSVDYVSTAGMTYASEKFGGTGGRIFNDNKTPEQALIFYKDILTCMQPISTDDVTIYWWYANTMADTNMRAFKETGWKISQSVIWLKNSLVFSPGQNFHRIFEPCLVGWKEGKAHYKDTLFSNYSELWTIDFKKFEDHLDVWYNKRDNTQKYIHPTQKPVRLAERALKRSSERGDIVLDAFGGSGSTMMACEQLGRKARLMELDPKYVDAIVKRFMDYTKTKEDVIIKRNGKVITSL